MQRAPRAFRFMWLAAMCLLVLGPLGCSYTTPARRNQPYDAVIVPGCPSAPDGSLSTCQSRRAAWAAIVWERGLAKHFITSGSAVYSPYVEAEHLAAALTALGVPADRIYVDSYALHTDENMYNAMRIARHLKLDHLAVASDGAQATGGCSMVTGWQHLCTPLPMEHEATQNKLRQAADVLASVRTAVATPWRPREQVEAEREAQTGRRRLPSAVLYPWMWVLRQAGRAWIPISPAALPIVRWSDRLAGRPASATAGQLNDVQPIPQRVN